MTQVDMNSNNIMNFLNNAAKAFLFLSQQQNPLLHCKASLEIPTFFLVFFEIPYFLLNFLQHLKFLFEQCCQ